MRNEYLENEEAKFQKQECQKQEFQKQEFQKQEFQKQEFQKREFTKSTKKPKERQGVSKRAEILYLVLGIFFLVELGVCFFRSGLVPGASDRADKLKVYAETERDDATILPGDLFDRNGKPLVRTTLESVTSLDAKGREIQKTVRQTRYENPLAYSQVVGYTGSHELNLLAAAPDQVVGPRRAYRLMAYLDEGSPIFGKGNGLYATVSEDGRKGQSAVLTLDDGLQTAVYNALAEEMDPKSSMGGCVVLDVKTGEILAMVAFPAFDFNQLTESILEMFEMEEETGLQPGYPVTHKNAMIPGSVFKILVAASLLEHGMEDLTVKDEAFYVDGQRIHNAYASFGDQIQYGTALEKSSNVFFATAALQLGAERLQETAKGFLLEEGKEYLDLDVGHVPYHFNVTDQISNAILAQTGFGQGKTTITLLHMAGIFGAIANDGDFMKPYLVKELVDAKQQVVYQGKPECLSHAVSAETAGKLREALGKAALYGSISHRALDRSVNSLFQKYDVGGKTGTAENGDGTNNAWFVSMAPATGDPQYVVAVNQCKCEKGGFRLMAPAAKIYQYLFETYQGSQEN